MWFRVFIATCTAALLGLLSWLATHESSIPTVLGRYSPAYFVLLLGLGAVAALTVFAQFGAVYGWLSTRRWEIVLPVVSVAGALLVAEAGVRTFEPFGLSYFEESTRYHSDKMADPGLVYRHVPNLRRRYQGVLVQTNELGFRDRELEPKQSGELRILLLGDSVTFGWGVPVEATFARKMEAAASAELGRRVRTVNTGVGSYNTVQEYAVLRAHADAIDPDIVFLLYVSNDTQEAVPFVPRPPTSFEGKSPPEVIQLLSGYSMLDRLVRFVLVDSHFERAFDPEAPGVRGSMEALAAIADFCRQRGIEFMTFVYRMPGKPPDELATPLLAKIRRVGAEHDFPVIDVGSWWDGVDLRSVTNSTIDSHPNARGHEILARRMTEVLIASRSSGSPR